MTEATLHFGVGKLYGWHQGDTAQPCFAGIYLLAPPRAEHPVMLPPFSLALLTVDTPRSRRQEYRQLPWSSGQLRCMISAG